MNYNFRFRLVRALLWLDVRIVALLVGTAYLPVLVFFPDVTVLFLLFILCLALILWLGSIPGYSRREDGTLYHMDAQEQTEKYFISKGWWIHREG